ncbi:MAG TPA: hypothetical protein VE033_09945 [Acetobacteraceae bacterium]|nr:hypothetical protein [Acetobacteraceae bacterium]
MIRVAPLLLAAALGACGPSYSPDQYATRAAQQANRVEQGVVIGARPVVITAEGSTGATTGAAAGGIVGSQTPAGNMTAAIGAVGGALVGGLFGTAAERAAGDTPGTEYIVRKTNGELVSVTQRDAIPLAIGIRVLVIAGAQARIVRDYTTEPDAPPRPQAPAQAEPAATPAAAPAATPAAAPAAASPATPAEAAMPAP